jgi:hypothetical protein
MSDDRSEFQTWFDNLLAQQDAWASSDIERMVGLATPIFLTAPGVDRALVVRSLAEAYGAGWTRSAELHGIEEPEAHLLSEIVESLRDADR